MFKKYRSFKTVNISGIRNKALLIFVMLLLSVSFICMGLYVTLNVDNGLPSSTLDRVTRYIAAETLASIVGESIPYLSEQLRLSGVDKSPSRICFELATNINFKDPRTFLGREIPLFSFFDSEIYGSTANLDYNQLLIESAPPANLDQEIERAMRDSELNKPIVDSGKIKNKKVLVYSTHYMEAFYPEMPDQTAAVLKSKKELNPYDAKANVTQLGKYLVNKLEQYGIGAERRYKPFRELSYNNSKTLMADALRENKDMKYLIDIHRDTPREKSATTLTVNGKSYAKFRFVVGKASKYYEQSFKLAQDLHSSINKLYPNLSKSIYSPNKTKTTNGEYNQSVSPGAILIEVGGQDNNFEELYRSLDILAKALAKVISAD